jgi:hypothetical protein
MTLMELMLALSISVLVGGAIAGMMDALTSGVLTHRDMRESMVRASTAQVRLKSYIETSSCVLDTDGTQMVLWRSDRRVSGTVHATELRWIIFDADKGELQVDFVAFPDGWTDTVKSLADDEYELATADWDAVRSAYDAAGHLETLTLADGLDDVSVILDDATATTARQVAYDMSITTESGSVDVQLSCAIRAHEAPEN